MPFRCLEWGGAYKIITAGCTHSLSTSNVVRNDIFLTDIRTGRKETNSFWKGVWNWKFQGWAGGFGRNRMKLRSRSYGSHFISEWKISFLGSDFFSAATWQSPSRRSLWRSGRSSSSGCSGECRPHVRSSLIWHADLQKIKDYGSFRPGPASIMVSRPQSLRDTASTGRIWSSWIPVYCSLI